MTCTKCQTEMVFFNDYFFIYISIHKLKVLDTQNPWKWRCPKHCCNRQSTCFLNATKKFYNVFVATYMWIHEYPPKIIVRESGISQDTLPLEGNYGVREREPELVALMII